MRAAFALSLMIGVSISANVFAAGTGQLRDKWAILVGVDTFQDPSVPQNKESANNVQHLAATLKDPAAGHFAADHVVVLTGPKATKSGIEQSIAGWLEKKALPDDLVFVYISSASIQGPKGEPTVFSYDTLGSEPDLSGINLRDLAAELRRRIQSRNIVMVIDASPAAKNAPDFSGLSELGVTVITATAGNQKSINNGELHTSLFEAHLAEAIKHNNGGLTLQEIYQHLATNVSEDAQKCFSGKQTPVLAVAKNNPAGSELAIGGTVRNSAKATINMGHPIDKLALTRPDLVPPRVGAGVPVGAAAKAAPLKKPVQTDDDDDDDKPRPAVDFGAYMAKMKQDIQKNWKPPKGLETRRLVAVFTIMRDGKIVSPSIVEGSGVEGLDKSALDALSAASPLDPLPPGSPRSVDIKYKFDWNVHRD